MNHHTQVGPALTLLLLLCLSSCTDNQHARLPDNPLLLAFGDSLTQGKGVSAPDSYPAVLAKLCACRVSNHGISGETTTQGLKRLPSVLDQAMPNLVILMHGGNDILRNHSPATTKRNLAAMIEMIHARGAPVLLVGIPAKRLFLSSAPFYEELADEYDLLFEEEIVAALLKQSNMKSDTLHFNKAGYAAVAERLHEVLIENGLLR